MPTEVFALRARIIGDGEVDEDFLKLSRFVFAGKSDRADLPF
jgi:hypothetical protein